MWFKKKKEKKLKSSLHDLHCTPTRALLYYTSYPGPHLIAIDMAITIAEIPGIYSYIRRMVVDERKTHMEVSESIKRLYPRIPRGLSKRSVMRFCAANSIHASSRISDQALDILVRSNVTRVSKTIDKEKRGISFATGWGT